ncbi:MAG TPA: hypothetical protein VJM31_01250 [Vicinamibacterales bacterium]|nr:hypothetical protein [Vicinamibacterales bacterium]
MAKKTRKQADDIESSGLPWTGCPHVAAEGTFRKEFADSTAGATAALAWLRERTAWIRDTFVDFCDDDCPRQQFMIFPKLTRNQVTRRNEAKITFWVICTK